jgi:dienelactone hydrolase
MIMSCRQSDAGMAAIFAEKSRLEFVSYPGAGHNFDQSSSRGFSWSAANDAERRVDEFFARYLRQ